MSPPRRSAGSLREVADPAWPQVEAWIRDAAHPVQVLPVDAEAGARTLERLQVTAHSVLGALALHTGGLLVDHGWLRILGGGAPPMNLAEANGIDGHDARVTGRMLVAFDVLGGRFELNFGALEGETGEVCYFAPDSLDWMPLGFGFSAFVSWSMTSALTRFFEELRWTGWEAEVTPLTVDRGIHPYPPPFTREGHDLGSVSRAVVPVAELFSLYQAAAVELRDVADGQEVRISVRRTPPN